MIFKSVKCFIHNQRAAPFETMLGFFCVYGGVAGLINFGITSNAFRYVLGAKATTAFNILYLVAGLSMYFGIGLNRHNIEAFGLIAVATSIIVRTIIMGWILGFNPAIVNLYVLNAAFVFSCIIRLITIIRLYNSKSSEVLLITK